MTPDDRLRAAGIDLPDLGGPAYYGLTYGRMATHRIVGPVLYLSGHTPVLDGRVLHPGRVGEDVTVEDGYAAARRTGINMLAGMRHALGDLGRVKGLIRCVCYVACAPGFHDVHLVSNGCTDLLAEILGDPAGIGGRATIGVQSLCDRMCFETVAEVEIA